MKILNYFRFLKKTYVYVSLSLPIVVTAILVSKSQSTSLFIPLPKDPLFAFSFDYQECLANTPYQNRCTSLLTTLPTTTSKLPWDTMIPYYNLRALGFIAKTIYCATPKTKKMPPVFLFNGSNRQFFKTIEYPVDSLDYFRDAPLPIALNSIESLYEAMQTLFNQENEVRVDKTLLEDIYNQKELGSTWKVAKEAVAHTSTERTTEIVPLKKEYIDRSKFDILYTQIHQLVQSYPNYRIHFHFFDNNEHILSRLKIFFETNPDLIPLNVSLSLVHYDGDHLSPTARVEGTGTADTHYRESILSTYRQFREVARNAKLDKITLLSQPQHLLCFKKQRDNYVENFSQKPCIAL